MSRALHRLPSLDLLRGFVAVGRRMSMTLAAHDLCLTQSAVSRQVRELEQRLGIRLFIRAFRALEFTEEGARLFARANSALDEIQDAIGALGARAPRRRVTLTTTAGIARLWLMPRLGRFRELHPEVELQITTDNRVLDLRLERIDLAIRYMPPHNAPVGATLLFPEELIPVVSPLLLPETAGPLHDRLSSTVLLDLADARHPGLTWEGWLKQHGLDASAAAGVLRFNEYDQVIQAALEGLGVAVGRRALVASHLAAGRLRAWPDDSLSHPTPEDAYMLVVNAGSVHNDALRVANWIVAEAGNAATDA